MKRAQFATISLLLLAVILSILLNVHVERYSYISVGDDTIKHDRIKNEYFLLGISKNNPNFKEGSMRRHADTYTTTLQFHKLERFGDEN